MVFCVVPRKRSGYRVCGGDLETYGNRIQESVCFGHVVGWTR